MAKRPIKAIATMTINQAAGSVTLGRSAAFFAMLGRRAVRFCFAGVSVGTGRTLIAGSAGVRVTGLPGSGVLQGSCPGSTARSSPGIPIRGRCEG